jgi:serine/threonine protein phosphatase PrpC
MSDVSVSSHFYANLDLKPGGIRFEQPNGQFGVYTHRAPDKETENEDSALVVHADNGVSVLAVADGMGGSMLGAQASATAIHALAASLEQAGCQAASLREAILNGFEQANRQVVEFAVGAGTTLAAVEIQGRTIRPYHVGDSAILVTGQRGKVKLFTISHSPVGYALESGMLQEAEAINHEERHVVSNFVGTAAMRIEVGAPLDLAANDTVLIASDGLFDNFALEEIVALVRKGALQNAISNLVNACRDRMCSPASGHPSKPDDLTFILYRP